MKLNEWLRRYRTKQGLSLQELSDTCGVSKPYIAMIERGVNPKTGKPLTLSLNMMKKIALGTGRSLEELADEVEDIRLPEGFHSVNDDEAEVLSDYRRLDFSDRQMFKSLLSRFAMTKSSAGGLAM